MSVIEEGIPPQKFEIITARIASILLDELAGQLVFFPTEKMFSSTVMLERETPLNTSEYPAVIVRYVGATYKSSSQVESMGDNTYFIDVYNTGINSETTDGDQESTQGVKRLLGVCRSIFSNPYYATLGFKQEDGDNFIAKSLVRSVEMGSQRDDRDTENVSFGRLTLNVDATEDTGKISPTVLTSYVTEVKLFDTDEGLRYEQVKN